jgi:transcriptional regulator with XRE-family HTH domain
MAMPPQWSRRIRRERELRGWSQAAAVAALRAHAPDQLPSPDHVLRRWKSWEAGDHRPSEFYQRLVAATFGLPQRALFSQPADAARRGEAELVAATGMSTIEVVSRIRASDLDQTTLDALAITVDQLCSRYPYAPADQLASEARVWMQRIVDLRHHHLTLAQHREVLVRAGWLALLVGCLEYDLDARTAAEGTRRAALTLGQESGHGEIQAWAEEMRAWFALTGGDYHGVIAAVRSGLKASGNTGASVQLLAQEAKAWSHLGDRRQVEITLDKGRRLLDALPYPDNIANHFVVDPAKFDFYAMDCYRDLGETPQAESLAEHVLQRGVTTTGQEISPMRNSEARTTLGIVAAQHGDLEQAVAMGMRAFDGERKSIPHLLMSARQLSTELKTRFGQNETLVRNYVQRARSIAADQVS